MISSIYVLPYKDAEYEEVATAFALACVALCVGDDGAVLLPELAALCLLDQSESGHVTRSPPITAHLDHPAHLLLHHAALLPLLDVAHVLAHLTWRMAVII